MKKHTTTTAALAIVTLAVLFAETAAAQAKDRDFSVNQFQTAPGPAPFLTVENAIVRPKFSWSIGGLFDYQYRPLVLRQCDEVNGDACEEWGDSRTSLIEHHLSLDFYVGISLYRVLELDLVVPVVLYQMGDDLTNADGDVLVTGPAGSSGMDDIRVHVKLDLLHGVFRAKTEKFGLAVVEVLGIPVGKHVQEDSFMGDSFLTAHTKLAFTVNLESLRIGLNVGYLWREEKDFYMADIGQRITYGLGFDVKFYKGLHGLVEVFGQNAFSGELSSSPMEADGAIRYNFTNGLGLTVGGGGSIIPAVGSPSARAFLGLAYAPPVKKAEPGDRDKDGILDADDACPDDPEDKDEFEDEDGCPDPDNDGDGVLDGVDQCPNEAEDKDGFEDEDGCPETDNDKDGILDGDDKCPNEAEDMDEFEDEDGCPDTDNDKDGVLDADDQCPNEAEDADNFEDEDGCPDTDNDGDGILDIDDKCRDEKEVYNGVDDEDGCPDEGKTLVVIEDKQLKIMDKINFATNSDKIVGAKSFKILDTIVTILKTNPSIRLRIEGHTDNKGKHDHNMDLSQRRAESVKAYLVDHGIDESRLVPVGFGPDKPIADNDSKAGRAKNRRVEFHIIGEEEGKEEGSVAP
jgi:outer membrane protein OmpA-like peptidoglycan-associated protein